MCSLSDSNFVQSLTKGNLRMHVLRVTDMQYQSTQIIYQTMMKPKWKGSMLKRKDISNDLAHQSGKCYKAISELSEVLQKDYLLIKPVSDCSQNSQNFISQEIHTMVRLPKHPRAPFQNLHASVYMGKVKVHDKTIRKKTEQV
ncbi:hypothetical protein XENORESO_016661 [Xenotaenia resolanae]|uniref:Uncharacterized protein n=1 Tax=Xenotaenia resolanae TaxID=208358 RepID=A0ABV0W1S7_9TELE